MRSLVRLSLAACAVSVVALLGGCAGEATQTAVVLYDHPDATLLAYEPWGGAGGIYVLCEKGEIVVVRTDRTFGVGSPQTIKINSKKGKCTVS